MEYCCFLLTRSCLTVCNPMDCSPPRSSVRRLFQAWILEWVAVSFSKIAGEKLLYNTRSPAWCSVMTRIGWDGGWEGGSRGRWHMNNYDWFALLYCWNQHNIVKQLPSNQKNKTMKSQAWKRGIKEEPFCSGQTWQPYFIWVTVTYHIDSVRGDQVQWASTFPV